MRAPVEWFAALIAIEILVLSVLLFYRERVSFFGSSRMPGLAKALRHDALAGTRKNQPEYGPIPSAEPAGPRMSYWMRHSALITLGTLALTIAGYLFYAGPYTEISADIWDHMGRFQSRYRILGNGCFTMDGNLNDGILFRQGYYWYWIHACLCRISGLSILQSLTPLTWANTLVLAFAYYGFALKIFAGFRCSRIAKCWMAALAALFFLAHQGVNIFAYARYYAFAPALLNYVVFMAFMVLIIDYVRTARWFTRGLLFLLLFLPAMFWVHAQEVIFAYFMTLAFVGAEWIKRCGTRQALFSPLRLKLSLILLALLAGYAFVFAVSRSRPIGPYESTWFAQLGGHLPVLKGMLVMSPLAVGALLFGLWGLVVYGLFFAQLGRFRHSAFLLGGMLMPLFTLFNPLTTGMFARLSCANVLYRTSYLIPFAMIAGYSVVRGISETAGRLRRPAEPAWRKYGNLPATALLMGLLIATLFPIDIRSIYAPYSRMVTLRRIPAGNDAHWWGDLLDYLNRVKGKHIVTDQVTGYIISGATPNDGGSLRFDHPNNFSWWLNPGQQDVDLSGIFGTLEPGAEWLLVVNRRDGPPSAAGRIAGHWPEDIMRVTPYYSARTIAFVKAHPESFHKIWEQDRIQVFEIVLQRP